MRDAAARKLQAAQLQEDIDHCRPTRQFTEAHNTLTVDEAYEMQRTLGLLRVGRGERQVGYKVGCTSSSVRQAFGLTESVAGCLWDTEQHASGASFNAAAFRRLAIEGELAVWLLSTNGPPAEWLIEYEPVIELHHFCFDGTPSERASELIARNCIHAVCIHTLPQGMHSHDMIEQQRLGLTGRGAQQRPSAMSPG
mmetsp:Transcript_16630/g.27610  ORF Transcript_16630/g.27610 Transcript_16630/m.27610 type:complete len:196 (-) Transcript_16630:424-1011(-)